MTVKSRGTPTKTSTTPTVLEQQNHISHLERQPAIQQTPFTTPTDPRSAQTVLALQRTIGNRATQHALTQQRLHDARITTQSNSIARVNSIVQRLITVDNIDYVPKDDRYWDGFINQANFYGAVQQAILGSPQFGRSYTNHWANVQQVLAGQNFNAVDIEALTTIISTAIQGQYGSGSRPNIPDMKMNALKNIVRDALVANISPNPQIDMDQTEVGAFDSLARQPNVTLSRTKGTASTIAYANLPNGLIQSEVNARLNEIRTERLLWNVAALDQSMLLHGVGSVVTGRQRDKHYQGNHTNIAGWLPQRAAPTDYISSAAQRLYTASSTKLKRILDTPDPLSILHNNGRPHGQRNEFQSLYPQHIASLTDAQVLESAMAALCAGVSAYIEFSMAGGISRLMYDPVAQKIYITAHYKWRQGYNPFFEVTGFPAV